MALFKHIKTGKKYVKLSDKVSFKEGILKKALVIFEPFDKCSCHEYLISTKEDVEKDFEALPETVYSRTDEFERKLDILLEDFNDLSYSNLADSLQYYADMLTRKYNQENA